MYYVNAICAFVHMWTLNTWMSVCQCYNTSAVARAVAIGCSEVALQVNVSVVRAQCDSRQVVILGGGGGFNRLKCWNGIVQHRGYKMHHQSVHVSEPTNISACVYKRHTHSSLLY